MKIFFHKVGQFIHHSIYDRRMSRRIWDFYHYISNFALKAFHFKSSLADEVNLRSNISSLKQVNKRIATNTTESNKIPPIIHFVYGFKQVEELPYYAFLAIKSALHFHPGWKIVFHFCHEPTGLYWESIKSELICHQVKDFNWFGRARIYHYAHKADVLRLLALKYIGGVYLDIDTLTSKSFEPLLVHPFVMGVQAHFYEQKGGLCNAVMLSAPHSRFVNKWLDSYTTFCSKGRDRWWDYHSVKLPALLSYSSPQNIKVLDHDAFFYPLWADVERILLRDNSAKWLPQLQDSFVFHLWNGFTQDQLEKIDPDFVLKSTSAYASIAKQVIGVKS
jgi:mannosyltransferase OCH1-like enzyme